MEERLLSTLEWPLELLHFLGTYAAKIGLCGTILGLCMHFLAFGTDSDSEMAAHAMAVALYTTLGALTIALVAEPAAYVLGWGERWFRADLRRWSRLFEQAQQALNLDDTDESAAPETPSGIVASLSRPVSDAEPQETLPCGAQVGEQGVG